MSVSDSFTSFTTLSADGNTATFPLYKGGVSEVTVYHGTGVTFGSGTLKLQVSPDAGTTWLDVPSASWTSATANMIKSVFSPVYGVLGRFNLAGSTSPTLNIAVRVGQVRWAQVDQFSFTANGSSAPFLLPGTTNEATLGCPNSDFGYMAYGTWGSGTLTLQMSPDGGTTWYAYVAGQTANGTRHVSGSLVVDTLFRLTLTGATSPSITAQVFK